MDHLRLLAALMVLGWHGLHATANVAHKVVPSFFVWSLFEEGHAGVALFITLSGFLFAALTHEKSIDYVAFVRSRWLRVFPLFAVWTLIAFYTSDIAPERLLSVLLTLLDRQSYPHVGWTVLVEFQLYLVFPFLLQFRRRYGLRYLFGIVSLCVLLRTLVWLGGSTQQLAYWTVFGRADQFILGMIAFEAYSRYARWLGQPLLFLAVFLALAYGYHGFNQRGGYYDFGGNAHSASFWIYFPTLQGLGFGWLIAAYLALRVPIPRLLDRPLAWLGTISYSLYLNHPIVLTAGVALYAKHKLPLASLRDTSLLTFGVVLPVLVAGSALTYYLVELPFLQFRRGYTRPLDAVVATPSETVLVRSPKPPARLHVG